MDGIKSKERVQQYGEVFTPDSIVNDMIDLVDEAFAGENNDVEMSPDEYISKTWLEPACGDGQFLIRILYRKLEAVNKLPLEKRPLAIVKGLTTIYGVDIQEDNVIQARNRMFRLLCGNEVETFDIDSRYNISIDTGVKIEGKLEEAVKHVLDTNIKCGNTLKPDELQLTDWQFDGENVTTSTVLLQDLNSTINQFDTVSYLDLPSRLNGRSSDDEAGFDDF